VSFAKNEYLGIENNGRAARLELAESLVDTSQSKLSLPKGSDRMDLTEYHFSVLKSGRWDLFQKAAKSGLIPWNGSETLKFSPGQP